MAHLSDCYVLDIWGHTMSSKAWSLIRKCSSSNKVKDLQTQLQYKIIPYICNTHEVQEVHKES